MKEKKAYVLSMILSFLVIWGPSVSWGKVFSVGGQDLSVFGYLTQGVSYSLEGDEPDNEEEFNSAITTLFLEENLRTGERLKLYGSQKLTYDWIYDIKSGDDSWQEKEFDETDELRIDDEYWQVIHELHATWSPGNAVIRAGKQIAVWGEMDGNRIMDQINPVDQRRGFADVEFESSIIPIWLVKAEYFPEIESDAVLDLGFELVFNPNADFIPSQPGEFGNDVGGVWTPNFELGTIEYADMPPMPPMFPGGPSFPGGLVPVDQLPPGPLPPGTAVNSYQTVMGKQEADIDQPDNWSSDGFEYALRMKTVVYDTLITLNYFYGRENLPVTRATPGAMPNLRLREDGTVVMETKVEGFYPLLRYAGATLSRDINPLTIAALGGVAPVIRIEGFYGFSNTYTTSTEVMPGMFNEGFKEFDEVRWGVGLDWKVKCNLLNPRAYFMISPQFFGHHIFDYPDEDATYLRAPGGAGMEEDNYSTSLMVSTSYLHNKLMPSFFWLHDSTNDADFYRAQLKYDFSDTWQITLGGMWLGGNENNKSFELFENKDQVFFKIGYKFN